MLFHTEKTITLSPSQQRYEQAEKRLFQSFGLSYQSRHIDLTYPPMKIRTLSIGEGQPVLVVAGGIGNAAALASLFAHLQDFQIISLDRPGSGLSDPIDHTQVNLRQLAVHTLESVVDSYGLNNVPVISNSMGGLWAFWFGLDCPERVLLHAQMGCPALVLSTSAPLFMRLTTVPIIGNVVHHIAKPKDVSAARQGLKFMGHSPDTATQLSDEEINLFYEMLQLPSYDLAWKSLMQSVIPMGRPAIQYKLSADMLSQVRQPVQFVWGDNDPFGDLNIAQQVCDILPDAHLHPLSGGHLPWLDEPEAVARVFSTFIDKHLKASI